MANLNGFDANTVENVSFEPIAAGRYPAVMADSELKANKEATGKYLECKFEIIEGEYKGRHIWARLSLEHKNELTARIARSQLAAICKAVGITQPRDSVELHNLPLIINVKVKKRTDNGELANDIKSYSKRESGTPAQSAPATKGIAPWKR
jgi:hypothetical protein